MDDFKVCANPYKTLVKVTFSVLETGLGEHNLDSRVGFIAKVSSGSIWQVGKQSAWTISRRTKLVKILHVF